MTAYVNDTLQRQIERGEVFYWSDKNQFIDPDETDGYVITTGANSCTVLFEVLTTEVMELRVYENPSSATTASTKTLYNMNRNSANTITTTVKVLNTRTGGTEIADILTVGGTTPNNSPFSKEVGLVLKPNEDYVYEITNYSGRKTPISYNVFLREL